MKEKPVFTSTLDNNAPNAAPAPAPAYNAPGYNAPGYNNTPGYNNVPNYNAPKTGATLQQMEQQQVQQRIQQSSSSDYPGVVGGTPANAKGVQGYDQYGNPIIPGFIAQRHQIEQSLGPTCNNGEYHDLRMHLTTSSLLFAVLIIPYCCGWRGKRETVCKKCNQKFPNIILPSA